jgi:hypothetical protein
VQRSTCTQIACQLLPVVVLAGAIQPFERLFVEQDS